MIDRLAVRDDLDEDEQQYLDALEARRVTEMPTTQQITDIVEKVRKRLAEGEREGIHLKVVSKKFDDDWLSIVVVPSKAGVRASEYANFMSKIERELREQGDDNVLLVPALED